MYGTFMHIYDIVPKKRVRAPVQWPQNHKFAIERTQETVLNYFSITFSYITNK